VYHEACAIPYRITDQRMEFCLISAQRTSRWEFPHTPIGASELPLEAAYRCTLEQAGLVCRRAKQEPLDEVLATQNRRQVKLTAYLLEVESAGVAESGFRIRWCFAEEARARIRRKPMRRLIDLALRQQPGQ
jgi:8-oxo-dGTP pyrophosphatase MutT (NUDIX family)